MENNENTIDTTSEFIWIADGNGMKHKHINFDNPNICPRVGIIEIEAMKKTDSERSLSNNASYAKFTDPKTGIIWGKPTGVHSIGKYIQYMRMRLGNNTFFDRTQPDQAEACAIVLKAIALGKFVDTKGRPRFKVRDKEQQAQADIDLRSWKRKALDIVDAIPYGEELKDIARFMAVNPDIFSPLVLANEVCNAVEKKPKEFLEIYNSPTKAYLNILKNAQAMGVIEFNPMEGFKYGGMNLGKTQELAITHLSKNPDLASSISTFTTDKRNKGAEQTQKIVTSLPIVTENEEMKALKQQLAEMKAKLEEKNLSTPSVDKKSPTENMVALREEAKALGVKGYQVPKMTYATLKAKVDAKKAEMETA